MFTQARVTGISISVTYPRSYFDQHGVRSLEAKSVSEQRHPPNIRNVSPNHRDPAFVALHEYTIESAVLAQISVALRHDVLHRYGRHERILLIQVGVDFGVPDDRCGEGVGRKRDESWTRRIRWSGRRVGIGWEPCLSRSHAMGHSPY